VEKVFPLRISTLCYAGRHQASPGKRNTAKPQTRSFEDDTETTRSTKRVRRKVGGKRVLRTVAEKLKNKNPTAWGFLKTTTGHSRKQDFSVGQEESSGKRSGILKRDRPARSLSEPTCTRKGKNWSGQNETGEEGSELWNTLGKKARVKTRMGRTGIYTGNGRNFQTSRAKKTVPSRDRGGLEPSGGEINPLTIKRCSHNDKRGTPYLESLSHDQGEIRALGKGRRRAAA